MKNVKQLGISAIIALGLAACDKKPEALVQMPAVKPTSVMIANVDVMDVEAGRVIPGRDVIVEGQRITAISPAGRSEAPAGALVIDGDGATLLPGLIDMHAHVLFSSAPRWVGELPDPPRNLQAYLYSGVTTVLDTGGMDNKIFDLREKVASGELLGPTIYATGPILTTEGGHPVALMERLVPWWLQWYIIPHQTRQADTPEEARQAVRDIASFSPDAIKLAVDRIPHEAPRLQNNVLKAAVDEAGKQGIHPVAHIGFLQDAVDTGEAGVTLWVHGVYQERIPGDQIARLASYGIPMVPTTVVFENYALLGRGPRVPTQLERETVSYEVLGAFDQVPETENNEYFRPYLEHLHSQRQNWRDNVRRLHNAGVTILAGSDMQAGVFPGAGLHRELFLLEESGLTPAEVIRAATLDAARFLAHGKEPEFGMVAEGKIADLVLVNGNPAQDLAAVSDIRAVIKAGMPLERRAINAEN